MEELSEWILAHPSYELELTSAGAEDYIKGDYIKIMMTDVKERAHHQVVVSREDFNNALMYILSEVKYDLMDYVAYSHMSMETENQEELDGK